MKVGEKVFQTSNLGSCWLPNAQGQIKTDFKRWKNARNCLTSCKIAISPQFLEKCGGRVQKCVNCPVSLHSTPTTIRSWWKQLYRQWWLKMIMVYNAACCVGASQAGADAAAFCFAPWHRRLWPTVTVLQLCRPKRFVTLIQWRVLAILWAECRSRS